MPVFRVERNKGYTVVFNYHLRDKRLSLKAKGLLSQILSLPEDWDYNASRMQQITYRVDMVGPEVVHYYDITWTKGGD